MRVPCLLCVFLVAGCSPRTPALEWDQVLEPNQRLSELAFSIATGEQVLVAKADVTCRPTRPVPVNARQTLVCRWEVVPEVRGEAVQIVVTYVPSGQAARSPVVQLP